MNDVVEKLAPLSHQQERTYLVDGLGSGSAAGNLGCVHWIDGDLDVPALTAAIAELHRRHEVLRTRYPSATTQAVLRAAEFVLPRQDFSALADPAGEVTRLVDATVDEPFDLAAAAPIRWGLYALGARRHALTLVVHHIVFDAWSKLVINDEISALYEAFHTGTRPAQAELPLQYADYAVAQRAGDGDAARAELDHWVRLLAGAPGCTRLPFDRLPSADTGFAGRTSRAPMRDSTLRKAELLAGHQHASVFMVLLAAFAGLLSRYGNDRDVVLGVPNAGRAELELERLVGCFADTVPFRIDLTGTPTFRELVARVRDTTLEAHDHQGVSLGRLVAALRPDREPGREPLVQVAFQVRNTPYEQLRLVGLEISEEARNPASSDLDLSVIVVDDADGVSALWQYKSELFDTGTIERLQDDYERLLERAVAAPDLELAELSGPHQDGPAHRVETVPVTPAVADRETLPDTETGRIVADIWAETLDLDSVAPGDNFFELGGHSLIAGQVVARLGELLPTLHTRSLMRDVLRYPVLATFAAVLDDRIAASAGPAAAGGRIADATRTGRIPLVDRDGPVALSLGQRRLWFLDQFVADSAEYFVPLVLRVSGELDTSALVSALREIVRRHEILRTSVVLVDDEPVGRVRPAEYFTCELADIGATTVPDAIAAETFKPFDLERGLPVRAALLRLGEQDHLLCVTVHHMVFDGWSVGIFFGELAALYGAFAAGEPSPLPELAAQYADVTAFGESRRDDPEFAAKLDFWRTELDGAEAFELGTDLPRPAQRTAPGAIRSFVVPDWVTARLEAVANAHGATLFMVLLAACQTLLYRHSGVEDITLGTTAADRDLTESESLIGLFINMLVLRGNLAGNPGFGELLTRTRDRTLDAYANQDVPFDRLVAELAGERDLSRTPVFQVMVKLGNARHRAPELPGLAVEQLSGPPIPAKYDIELDFTRVADGLAADLSYDTGLYLPDTVERLVRHLNALLVAIARDPSAPIDELGLLDADELAEVGHLTAPPPVEFPSRCLHDLVADQVAKTPDAIAVVQDDRQLSYAELDAWANRIAVRLGDHGVGPETVVGVLLDRSVEMVAALLGILKAGGAYLPIETDTPPARIARLLADSGAPVCLLGAEPAPRLAEVFTGVGCHPLPVPSPGGAVEAPVVDVRPDNLVAVYYTSGSTGRPKGVACTHAGWVNRMSWMQRHHPLQPGETVLHKTTLTFDDAAVEIFWPLLVGGCCALLGPGLHRDPRAIVDAVIRHRAVHVQFVPSVLDLFLETLTYDDVMRLGALRSVLSSGEALRPVLVRRFRDLFGDRVLLDNTWGATEVSIDSTCRVCGAEDGDGDGGAVSVGTPIDNNEVLVLDRGARQLPIGVPGELCIGGAGLARGYLGDPRRTAEAFTPHPTAPGARVYRTGDWGRLCPDGSLTFLNRRDDQVKVRGVRIEIGEVEHALRGHPSVADVAVIAWEAVPGDKRLAAYVVARAGAECSAALLVDHARGLLPGYAVPGSITVLDALPRHSNSKLDKRRLPPPDTRSVSGQASAEPSTATERVVADIWATVLGLDGIGVDDDFFVAGGHSLLATRAIARLRQAFTAALPLTLMFECPTPALAAAAIEGVLLAEITEMTDEEAGRLLNER